VLRSPTRFVVLFGFGTALLVAAAFERATVARRRAGIAAVVVATVAVLASRGFVITGEGFTTFEAQTLPIYDAVAQAARERGAGPLLELPLNDPQAMLGSTRHWLPLLTGATAYEPPHRPLLMAAISRLPAQAALDDLVDMTHLRWILLHPASQWPPHLLPMRDGLLRLASTEPARSLDGWDLLRVNQAPRRPDWFQAITAGPRPGRTLLGTPLAPLGAGATAVITAGPLSPAPLIGLPVRLFNPGATSWPAATAVPPDVPSSYTVKLVVRWWPSGVPHRPETTATSQEFDLPRDVLPREAIQQHLILAMPLPPGNYDIEINLLQVDGARFDGPGNVPYRAHIVLPQEPPKQ
jgi:hypothetical protein